MQLAWLLALAPVFATTVSAATLEKVLDGDTVIIREGTQHYHLRLLDIDAPELHQSYGKQSQRSLRTFCQKARIVVEADGTDRYGRTLGNLYCDGQNSSTHQITQGMAWFNSKFSQNNALADLQVQVQQSRIGLWQQENPVQPWVWRKLYGAHYRRQE
ncbi:thermonuclease family protein [Methylophilus aquaticus]|uniref:Thermonuclease family protein n=1 Tax=Methylophilus aquaticus TaxID=1971610 RepID=A0ABT9JTX1_9PROT|nr:thermonuclease family protein [Methylophilus aquaticus]MDP8568020.1 thermonuclease family protein [Methylophilus aquaticus]